MFCTLKGGHGEDESQQAAEAMVQLSGVGFYTQQGKYNIYTLNINRILLTISKKKKKCLLDESMDVDPNYDPSDFLKLASSIKVEQPDHEQMQQQEMQQQQMYEQEQYDKQIMEQQIMNEHQMDGQQLQQQQQIHMDQQMHHQQHQQEMYQQDMMGSEQMQSQQMLQYDQHHEMQQHQSIQQDNMLNMSDNMMFQSLDNAQHEVCVFHRCNIILILQKLFFCCTIIGYGRWH